MSDTNSSDSPANVDPPVGIANLDTSTSPGLEVDQTDSKDANENTQMLTDEADVDSVCDSKTAIDDCRLNSSNSNHSDDEQVYICSV